MIRTLLVVAVVLLVAACAGRATRPPVTEVTRIPENGNWFCQLAAEGQGWECVQDPALASSPIPERLPEPPAAPPASGSAPMPPDSALDPPLPGAEQPPPPATEAPPQAPPAESDVGEPPRAGDPNDAVAASSAVPDFIRLAYQPPQPIPLTALPPDFYVVQITAMKRRSELEQFARRHDLEELSSARVERDGELYYVLLLGVYETLQTARDVVTGLPPPLDTLGPWIRPVGALQAAMARAEALAQAAEP